MQQRRGFERLSTTTLRQFHCYLEIVGMSIVLFALAVSFSLTKAEEKIAGYKTVVSEGATLRRLQSSVNSLKVQQSLNELILMQNYNVAVQTHDIVSNCATAWLSPTIAMAEGDVRAACLEALKVSINEKPILDTPKIEHELFSTTNLPEFEGPLFNIPWLLIYVAGGAMLILAKYIERRHLVYRKD